MAVLYWSPRRFRSCLSPKRAALDIFTLIIYRSVSSMMGQENNLSLPVQESKKIEDAEHGNDMDVYFAEELPLVYPLEP